MFKNIIFRRVIVKKQNRKTRTGPRFPVWPWLSGLGMHLVLTFRPRCTHIFRHWLREREAHDFRKWKVCFKQIEISHYFLTNCWNSHLACIHVFRHWSREREANDFRKWFFQLFCAFQSPQGLSLGSLGT